MRFIAAGSRLTFNSHLIAAAILRKLSLLDRMAFIREIAACSFASATKILATTLNPNGLHHLECIMAAHGAGTVALSRQRKNVMMNIDIGGGTTKLALVQSGTILATAALEVGGRLIAFSEDRIVSRVEDPALRHAARAGVELERGKPVGLGDVQKLAEAEVEALIEAVLQRDVSDQTRVLFVTASLPPEPRPDAITFSGGVGEFVLNRAATEHGDLGAALGLESAGSAATLDRYIGYWKPYATSHSDLDHDTALKAEVQSAARTLSEKIM